MTFAAAICGKMKLGGGRLALVGIEADTIDEATVEAHRLAHRDHAFGNGFVGYKVLVLPASHLPPADRPIHYVRIPKDREEFNPDRSDRDDD